MSRVRQVDLDEWRGSFLESVHVADDIDAPQVTVVLATPEATLVLELAQVVHLSFDNAGHTFVDEIEVVDLPRVGRWPSQVHHLLSHHNNEAAMVWLQLIGPTTVEVLARTLAIRASEADEGQGQR
jgi:hypothetical protein